MTTSAIRRLIRAAGREPVERDTLYNVVTGPEPPLGAICVSPPGIDFDGKFTRCVEVNAGAQSRTRAGERSRDGSRPAHKRHRPHR